MRKPERCVFGNVRHAGCASGAHGRCPNISQRVLPKWMVCVFHRLTTTVVHTCSVRKNANHYVSGGVTTLPRDGIDRHRLLLPLLCDKLLKGDCKLLGEPFPPEILQPCRDLRHLGAAAGRACELPYLSTSNAPESASLRSLIVSEHQSEHGYPQTHIVMSRCQAVALINQPRLSGGTWRIPRNTATVGGG